MSRTDLISDSFTVIRNASKARKEEAYIPYSKAMLKICEILKAEGYLENFKEVDLEKYKKIKVYFKYDNKKSIITQIQKISKPGRRVYVRAEDVPSSLQGYGITIMSTSSGVLTDKQAKEKGIGGEIVGKIW